jgi:hypothetical protein
MKDDSEKDLGDGKENMRAPFAFPIRMQKNLP